MTSLSSVSQIARSGMQAAQMQLQAAANNIANLRTPDFQREEVVLQQQTGGGVTASTTRADQPGSALEQDVIAQLQARNAFLANLALFKAGNALAGVLLDERA